MKKKVFLIILMCVLLLPIKIMAASVRSENLESVLTAEGIAHDLSNYKETDDQVVIYLFRQTGCHHCRDFLNYLNSIVDEYGEKFKLVAYEINYNSANNKLCDDIATFLGYDPTDIDNFGVPFIIIGEKSFVGFGSSYETSVMNAIESEYNKDKDDRYDVLKDYEQSKKESEDSTSNTSNKTVLLINIAFMIVATLVIVGFNYFQNKQINDKLEEIQRLVKMRGNK